MNKILKVPGLALVFVAVFVLVNAGRSLSIETERNNSGPSGNAIVEYASDEFIVKFRSTIQTDMALALSANNVSSPSLSYLNNKFKVGKAVPVIKRLNGKFGIKTLKDKVNKIKARFPQRYRRVSNGIKTPDLGNIYILKVGKNVDLVDAIAAYSQDPDVEYAEPNFKVKAQLLPNDPYYSSADSWGQGYDDLWGLKKLQPETAWDLTEGQGVVVAVVDTGVDFSHGDLAANIWFNPGEIAGNGIDDDANGYVDDVKGWDFTTCEQFGFSDCDVSKPEDDDPADGHGHGTHCSGTIAAIGNNGTGVIGVAPRSGIMTVKGLNDHGEGSISDLANSIIYAADNGADVISNSWGGPGASQVIEDAVDYANSMGAVVVAAAGNSSANIDVEYFIPASIDNVITVASSDNSDVKSDFSNYGSKVDVTAPGGNSQNDSMNNDFQNILSLRAAGTDIYGDGGNIVGTDYYRARGTSMSAPHVSGLTALIIAANPGFTRDQIEARLIGSTDSIDALNPGHKNKLGSGRINADNAVNGIDLHPHFVIQTSITSMDFDPGSTVDLILELKNKGESALGVIGVLSSSDPLITINKDNSAYGDISAGSSLDNSADPFNISLDSSASYGKPITFRLSLSATGGYQQDILFVIRSHMNVGQGWPFVSGDNDAQNANLILADLDNDNKEEIIFYETSTLFGNGNSVYVLNENGEMFNDNWPKYFNGRSVLSVSIGDLDGDAVKDLVVDTMTIGGSYAKKKYFLSMDAQPVGVGEIDFGSNDTNRSLLADINADGRDEIIFVRRYGSDYEQKVFAYDYLGNKIMESSQIHYAGYFISAGDIDGDGFPEIVGTHTKAGNNSGEIYIVQHNGSVGYIYVGVDLRELTLGDINNDGSAEIIVYGTNQGTYRTYLFAYTYSGAKLWQREAGQLLGSANYREPVISNIDSDEELEILFYNENIDDSGKLFAFNHDGTNVAGNWPVTMLGVNYSSSAVVFPVVGDIDGDSDMEILLTGKIPGVSDDDLVINAWHHDGTGVVNWPLYTAQRYSDGFVNSGDIALGDIDNNGRADLVLMQSGSEMQPKVSVNVYELGITRGGFQWPMYHHDPQHTGMYFDPDGDDIMDDGDGSGTAGDNPCTGGNTVNCDDNCRDIYNPDQADSDSDRIGDACDINVPTYKALTVGINGSGSGTVTSSSEGIDCGLDCTETYIAGTVVTLTATPVDGTSVLVGWTGGGCNGTGDCVITMDADADITATFDECLNSPVMIGDTYYSSIGEAYNMSVDEDVIQSQNASFTENLVIDHSISLIGGYGCDYTAGSGKTILYGDLMIIDGTVTIENFILD